MQFAERSRATGSIALVLLATTMAAGVVQLNARNHHHHRHHHLLALEMPRCRDQVERIEPPPSAIAPPVAQVTASSEATSLDLADLGERVSHSYDGVLASAAPLFARCFAHDSRATELLVTIAPDGRVRATTTRPEPETHTSRCLANVVRGLVFPSAPTTVMMRVPLSPQP